LHDAKRHWTGEVARVLDGADWIRLTGLAVVTGLASAMATGVAVRILGARAMLAHPNDRSSHSRPTPQGGGLAVVPVVVVAWIVTAALLWPGAVTAFQLGWVLVIAVALAALSWWDDLSGLSPALRLAAHAAAVAVALAIAPAGRLYLQGLVPQWLDPLIAGVLWVWFVNLFNFMDGIDGIAGVETIAVGIGAAAVGVFIGLGAGYAGLGVAIAAAALGFLWWNWQPAKIFLGDVGSIPLGFLLGWLLLELAAEGAWAAALILPAYYLADATITLFRRAFRGETVWQAHRDHFYQLAVRRGWSHARVAVIVAAANLLLVILAAASTHHPLWPVLAGAVVIVAALLAVLGARTAGGGKT
jgi:UDP-N-acetylmuramyl pentapeptide phosphotransferase/UDP-N-acetylglucosamine-1-phosphate transferase